MKRTHGWKQWNRRSRMAAIAILLCALLLAGCGNGVDGNGELPTKMTEETAVTVGLEEQKQEPLEQFHYDFTKMYIELFEMPVIEEEQAREEGRVILTLQQSVENWLTGLVEEFNRRSTTYYIRLQESGSGEELRTCRTRMAVELTAGKGPDIFTWDVFPVNENMLKKGIVENLAPALDVMGVTDREYFPGVRALSVEDRVYGVCPSLAPYGYCIQESVLGSREKPDIETLVEKVYTYPDQEAVWWPYASSRTILSYFLCGSEDLWGMIDWEEGKCDFSGDMFAKMLEIAKRYADPEGRSEEGIAGVYFPLSHDREQLESEGKVIIDYLFDDGCYPCYRDSMSVLMLNANSEHLEGAWEFLEFLLSKEGQVYVADCGAVNKPVFDSFMVWELDMIEAGKSTLTYTEKWVEEIRDYAERARYLPMRTDEILEIIYEEAESFFYGDKPKAVVCDIIQNRVQLYLNEMM